jgi:hypothetical protein
VDNNTINMSLGEWSVLSEMSKDPQVKSEVTDWKKQSRLWHRVKVDSGIGLPNVMVNVLESTLEWT